MCARTGRSRARPGHGLRRAARHGRNLRRAPAPARRRTRRGSGAAAATGSPARRRSPSYAPRRRNVRRSARRAPTRRARPRPGRAPSSPLLCHRLDRLHHTSLPPDTIGVSRARRHPHLAVEPYGVVPSDSPVGSRDRLRHGDRGESRLPIRAASSAARSWRRRPSRRRAVDGRRKVTAAEPSSMTLDDHAVLPRRLSSTLYVSRARSFGASLRSGPGVRVELQLGPSALESGPPGLHTRPPVPAAGQLQQRRTDHQATASRRAARRPRARSPASS